MGKVVLGKHKIITHIYYIGTKKVEENKHFMILYLATTLEEHS